MHSVTASGRASARRDDVQVRVPTASPVLLARSVLGRLGRRDGVHGRHQPLLEPDAVVDHLRHGRETVGRAARVADHGVPRGVIGVVVDSEADGRNLPRVALGRRRDDDPLRPGFQVPARRLERREEPGRLEDVVDALALPRQLRGFSHREGARAPAVDGESVTGDGDLRQSPAEPEASLHAVVAEQVGKVVGRDQVVHRGHLEAALGREPVDESTDAPEAVDADADRHDVSPPQLLSMARCTTRRPDPPGRGASPLVRGAGQLPADVAAPLDASGVTPLAASRSSANSTATASTSSWRSGSASQSALNPHSRRPS